MLQLRQQRRQAAELRINPAAAAEGSAPLLSDEAPAGSSTSTGNSGGNPGNFYAEGEEGAANRQRLNIVGPPERSPTLEGGPAYEEPRPLSRSVATSTAELPADNGLYHVSEPLRTVWFRPGAAGHHEGSSSSNSSTSNLQLRRISRLNSAPGGGVTLATNNGGGSRGPRIGVESGGAVASGIFEESVQRVTLAVGEEAAAPPPPPPLPQLPHQEQEEEEQEMVEEERIVEDIVREMMRNEGSVRQRWVTYCGVGTLPVMIRKPCKQCFRSRFIYS
jgi:hypothetical protein